MNENAALRVKDLQFFRNSHQIVRNLNFSLQVGECLALVGVNGTGKSTLLNLLAGLLLPHRGQVLINGADIHLMPRLAKQQLGFLPDQLPLYPELTVKEYLQLVAKLRHIPKTSQKEAIDNVLEDLHLTTYRHSLIGILSRGLKQRIGIAQAIIHKPLVVLLDEPTQGLDPTQIENFQLLIAEKKKYAAIVLSTHHLSEVEMLHTKVMQLKHQDIPAYDTHDCPA